jgi:thymidine kinase
MIKIRSNKNPDTILFNLHNMTHFLNTPTFNIQNISTMKSNIGYLELIIGPMYSGKTSSIIELNKQYTLSNMRVCIVNYAQDKRYDDKLLSTHDKRMIECHNILQLSEIEKDVDKYDVFLINEGQFFPDLFNFVKYIVDDKKKIVHVCGLDGDFKRNGFPQIIQLIPHADSIIKKYSICKGCQNGTKALFSHRLSNETEVKVIGADNYIPLCRNCYNSYNALLELTS